MAEPLTALQIKRIGVKTWTIIENGIAATEKGENAYTGGAHENGTINIKTMNGATVRNQIPFQIISYTDTIDSSNNRASFTSAAQFLKYGNDVGFFVDGSSGSGATTSFTQLEDTFPTYIGREGQALVVNESATGIDTVVFNNVSVSTQLGDFPPVLVEGKYLKVVGGVWQLVDGIEGDQNNVGKVMQIGFTNLEPLISEAVQKANNTTIVVSEQNTPVILYIRSLQIGQNSKRYPYLFLPGKGTYGVGGNTVTASMLYPLAVLNTTPDDIESDPNNEINNLDPVIDGDFVTKANQEVWPFTDSTYPEPDKNYYFTYTDDGVLYFALFVGEPGVYGTGGIQFTEDDFVTTTNSEVQPEIPNVTKTSDIENDGEDGSSPYATQQYVEEAIGDIRPTSIYKQSFQYTGGLQNFVLDFEPSNVLMVVVQSTPINGVGIAPIQYTVNENILTIIDPLDNNDYVWILYSTVLNDTSTYTKSELDSLLAANTLGFKGSIDLTTPAPTQVGLYTPTVNGTYINYGNIIVDLSEGLTIISYDGNSFTKLVLPLDLSNYATIESTQKAIDVSNMFFDNVYTKTYESFDDTVYPPIRQDTTSTFSGWECAIGKPVNFQKVQFKVRVRATVVNTIKCRIFDSETNTTLAEKTLTGLNLDTATIHNIEVDFEENIANSENHKLMFGYLCDQFIDRIGIVNSTLYPYPEYPGTKYATNGGQNFSVMTNTNATARLNFVELISATSFTPNQELADDLLPFLPQITDSVETTEIVNEAIYTVLGVNGTENFPISDAIFRDNTSTFSGWGSSIGVRNNFNALQFRIKARTVTITSVYYELRETNKNGNLLASGYLTTNITPTSEVDLIIPLPNIVNGSNLPLWFGYQANQVSTLFAHADGTLPYTPSYAAYKTTGAITPGTWTDISSGDRNIWVKTGQLLKIPYPTEVFANNIAEVLDLPTAPVCDIIVPSELYAVEGLECNIFFKNSILPPYGVPDDNFTVDLTGVKGAHYNRRWKYTPGLSDSGTYSLQIDVRSKRDIISTKTTSIKVADSNAGSGVTRKILLIGDSTVDGDDITIPLKSNFDGNPMSVQFVGTRGGTGLKHEGRGGWTYNDYFTVGRTYFKFNVTGLTNPIGLGSVYSNNGSQFTVEEVNITDGSGYFSTTRSSGGANPLATGTLTLVSGSGDASITYGSYEIVSGNPFWNPTTLAFDFQYYLTTTGQTMSAGDWVNFQLGINDVFGITSLDAAVTKTNTMYSQLQSMISNIQSAVPGIRVGVLLIIPPAANQDAFAVNYGNGQTREMYLKTGWLTWNKKLLADFDNSSNRSLNRFIVSASLNLDPEYGYPVSSNLPANSRTTQILNIQTNAVHPSTSGNAQIADSYTAIIKNFA